MLSKPFNPYLTTQELTDYDTRPYIAYKTFESCVDAIHGTMYIGIYGYVGGNYKLLAKESPPKAVLLLHGLNSDASTWNGLDSQYLHHMKCYPNLLIHIYHNHQN
jgi:hypothetical protein